MWRQGVTVLPRVVSKLLILGDPSVSASQSTEVTGVSHCVQLGFNLQSSKAVFRYPQLTPLQCWEWPLLPPRLELLFLPKGTRHHSRPSRPLCWAVAARASFREPQRPLRLTRRPLCTLGDWDSGPRWREVLQQTVPPPALPFLRSDGGSVAAGSNEGY